MSNFELIKFKDNELELDVRTDFENETVWLTQEEISILFETDRTRITRHINDTLEMVNLVKKAMCGKRTFLILISQSNYIT